MEDGLIECNCRSYYIHRLQCRRYQWLSIYFKTVSLKDEICQNKEFPRRNLVEYCELSAKWAPVFTLTGTLTWWNYDNSRRFALFQHWQQLSGENKCAECVGGKVFLKPIFSHFSRVDHATCIVHEYVQLSTALCKAFDEFHNLARVRHIKNMQKDVLVSWSLYNFCLGLVSSGFVSANHMNSRSFLSQGESSFFSDATISASNHEGSLADIRVQCAGDEVFLGSKKAIFCILTKALDKPNRTSVDSRHFFAGRYVQCSGAIVA